MNTLHLCELNSMGFIPHLYKIDRELFLILKKVIRINLEKSKNLIIRNHTE
jgi:hypothetical protein